MSLAESVSPPTQSGRRSHARRRMEGLVYVDFGPDNGAILIDLGEGGLGFQSVVPVTSDQALLLKFKLPGDTNPIEGYAEVAWLTQSGKSGGLRFVELSADASAQIRGWTGVLSGPDPGAPLADKGIDSNPVQASAAEGAPASTIEESPKPEPTKDGEAPAQISEVLAPAESAPAVSVGPEADEAPPVDAPAGEQLTAGQSASPDALLAPEIAVDTTTAAASSEPLATQVESVPSAGPSHPGPEIEPAMQDAPPSQVPSQVAAGHAGGAAMREFASGSSAPTLAIPGKGIRTPASDSGNLSPAQKRQRRPAPPKPEPSLPPAERLDSPVRGSLVRQSQKPLPTGTEWQNPLPTQEDEVSPQAMLSSQALKVGIGAAAGACLVLAIVAGIPSLRTRVQATAITKSSSSNLANSPAFQVEVADVNNRRWILGSGGEAGSPFSDTPSRRERQPEAYSAARNESAKSSRSNDSNDSSDTVNTSQPRLPRPGELALSRPHATQPQAPSAQLTAPSIFDGITPPIGSVSDRLAAGGPEAPGIVPPESQPAARTSALQAAVLVQRVAPVYPKEALETQVAGEVRISANIGRDGVPRGLKIISGDQRLVEAARAAISQWRYRPATLGGEPIETEIVITVAFSLK